jgi:hypothetical protein
MSGEDFRRACERIASTPPLPVTADDLRALDAFDAPRERAIEAAAEALYGSQVEPPARFDREPLEVQRVFRADATACVSAYLACLVDDLPEEAVEAATKAMWVEDEDGIHCLVSAYGEVAVRAFLSALMGAA